MLPESRVLVCDDESQTVRALRFVLRGAGFEVEATTTAGEALERAALRAPDAVILEMVLPDADGGMPARGRMDHYAPDRALSPERGGA